MNTARTLSLVGMMALSTTAAALAADTPTNLPAANTVGRWLREPNGDIIGSVRSLSQDGHVANVMLGRYFEPGSHEVQVPASSLSVSDGKVFLGRETFQALNTLNR